MNQPPADDPLSEEDTDNSLLAGCLAGKEVAWRVLVARHEPRLRAVAGRLLGPKARWDLVEDIVSNVWFSLWVNDRRRLQAFDPQRGSLAAYLGALTRQEVQRQLRAAPPGRFLVPLGNGQDIVDPRSLHPDWVLLWDEFLPLLPPLQRQYLQSEVSDDTAPPGSLPLTESNARKVRQYVLAKLQRFLHDL
jgi:DNA-directed RNA polymerase specialized sigma24 family protein